MLEALAEKSISGPGIDRDEALWLAGIPDSGIFGLFLSANRIREATRGAGVDLCSIVNAKSGACAEDCSYCAQSARARSGIDTYPLMDVKAVAERAREARGFGARRFCIVTAGRTPGRDDLPRIAEIVSSVRGEGLLPCATLGLLGEEELSLLKSAGLERYHHNLETSRRFFPEICRTHTYDEKMETIRAVGRVGLSLCSGGIFGLGEEWDDRVDMAMELRELGADSVPLNFLIPARGTPLEGADPLRPLEALKIVSLYRFLLPGREVRICGGRAQTLGEFNSLVFMAGADGLLIGNYLTTKGRTPEDDLALIKEWGLEAL